MGHNNDAPKKIYLLCYGESREESGEDIFWCEDRINDTDEEYYHVSEIERLREENKWLIENYATTVYLVTDGKMLQERIDDIKEAMQQTLKENFNGYKIDDNTQ